MPIRSWSRSVRPASRSSSGRHRDLVVRAGSATRARLALPRPVERDRRHAPVQEGLLEVEELLLRRVEPRDQRRRTAAGRRRPGGAGWRTPYRPRSGLASRSAVGSSRASAVRVSSHRPPGRLGARGRGRASRRTCRSAGSPTPAARRDPRSAGARTRRPRPRTPPARPRSGSTPAASRPRTRPGDGRHQVVVVDAVLDQPRRPVRERGLDRGVRHVVSLPWPPQARIRSGASSRARNAAIHWAAVAPSTGRWSTESVTRSTVATPSSPPVTTASCRAAPTARIAACGGLMTARELLGAERAEVRRRSASRPPAPPGAASRPGRARRAPAVSRAIDVTVRSLHAAHHRRHEPAVGGDGDGDVHRREPPDGVRHPDHVHLRQRARARAPRRRRRGR